jgi:quercetin 2,3-dioxygenase
MSYKKISANERGQANYGWLQANYSFSFSNWYNPAKMGFGALRVLNNDTVAPAGGFPTHSHEDMEIITIPLSGSIAHKDSIGTDGIIQTGEIQIMSAGTGISHSEYNGSQTEKLELFQIWVIPNQYGLKPRYDQTKFDPKERQNQWQTIVSPNPENHKQTQKPLKIYQESYFNLADLQVGETLIYTLNNPKDGIYLMIIEGEIEINEITLSKRDAVEITGENEIQITAKTQASILVIETV